MKYILLLCLALVVVGCDAPNSSVFHNGKMVVYQKEKREHIKYGMYRYYVRDGSPDGAFVLYTDLDLSIGDSIEITPTKHK